MTCATPKLKHFQTHLKLSILAIAVGLLAGCGSGSGTDDLTGSVTETTTTSDSILARRSDGPVPAGNLATQPDAQRSPRPVPNFKLTEIRKIDGTGNNVADLGSAGVVFAEDVTRAYGDGIETPSGETRPNPRAVSNAVVAQTEDRPDPGGRTAYLWLWGQFVDHDITLTHDNGSNDFPIEIPLGDPSFDPFGTGTETMPFSRSTFDENSGTSADNPRAQVNSITSFIDASMVYGSDEERASTLRTFNDGLLATSDGALPPYNTDGLDNAGGPSAALFLCGDVRANENVLLTSIHTLFIREHNRIATALKVRHPELTDEELYQGARKKVGGIIQAITFNEFIPALLGEGALPPYRGYRPEVDPRVGIHFATAAYRMGHSQVGTTVPRLDSNGEEIAEGNLVIADAFFNPSVVSETGIDVLLRGAASEPAQSTDAKIIDDLRNLLFGPPGAGGLDLASLNIQRGRDHGMPDYNTVRSDYGLPAVNDFTQMTSDSTRQNELASIYSSPAEVDSWVGLLSEDPVRGSVTGPSLRRILAEQFRKLRDGDRFFYLVDPDLAQDRDELNRTRLSDVIQRNTEVAGLQNNVFFEARPQRRPRPRTRQPNRKIPRPTF
jgi:peroxidase